ncbi:MAG: hypothetical protein RL662_1237 [Bacteroidota bacterium]|jgi:GNAT superfamily N-acetyltransferase
MINEVAYSDVLNIRHRVMYPEQEEKIVMLDNDNKGLHIGYYVNNKAVSVFSLFLENEGIQFRKFATLIEYQNKGYGTKLMEWLLDYAKDMKFKRVWCNARIEKTSFYEKFGFQKTEYIFEKNGYRFMVIEKQLND